MKNKLKLKDIHLSSFVTALEIKNKETIHGAAAMGWVQINSVFTCYSYCTNECNESINCTKDCTVKDPKPIIHSVPPGCKF